MATNLIESLIVLCLPMLLTIILPKRWFGDLFVSMSAALAIAGLGYTMYVALKIGGLHGHIPALLSGASRLRQS
jgi:hypothetical protein